jgi:hypothetical protein
MKQLDIKFTGKGQVRGYEFTQILSSDFAYIYLVDSGDSVYYEVFKKVENTFYGNISYPTNKAFGSWAWTTDSMVRAKEILERINENELNKKHGKEA